MSTKATTRTATGTHRMSSIAMAHVRMVRGAERAHSSGAMPHNSANPNSSTATSNVMVAARTTATVIVSATTARNVARKF